MAAEVIGPQPATLRPARTAMRLVWQQFSAALHERLLANGPGGVNRAASLRSENAHQVCAR